MCVGGMVYEGIVCVVGVISVCVGVVCMEWEYPCTTISLQLTLVRFTRCGYSLVAIKNLSLSIYICVCVLLWVYRYLHSSVCLCNNCPSFRF